VVTADWAYDTEIKVTGSGEHCRYSVVGEGEKMTWESHAANAPTCSSFAGVLTRVRGVSPP